MFARSVLWCAREIESCLVALHEQPILQGQPVTTRESDKARSTARQLVELLRGTALHRPSDAAARHDDGLEQVLAAMYATETAHVETVADALPAGSETINTLRAAGQLETAHGELYVPLRGTGSARNWPPLLRVLVERLGEFVDEVRTVAEKLRADGADDGTLELSLVRSLLRRLERLRTVLRSQLGQLQVVNYTVFVDSQIDRFLVDVVPAAFDIDTAVEETP